MGSWNKTCGLSNLPILSGEKAYVFVLEPSSTDDGHCYATHLYRPLLTPFETTYNDYGGGSDSTGPAFPVVMEAIKKNLHEMELGENKYHDIAVKADTFTEELFFEAVHEGRLFRKGNFADPVKLEYVMFRKDIVDYILENRKVEKYVGKGNGTYCPWNSDDKSYIQYKFADIVADVPALIEEISSKLDGKDEDDRFSELWDGIDRLISYDHPNKAAAWMRGDTYRYSRLVDMKDMLRQVFGKSEPTLEQAATFQAIIVEHLKGKFIDVFMECTRKSWIPAGHEGSQSEEYADYRLLMDATTATIKAREAQYEE